MWAHQVNYRYTSPIVDICTSKFHYGNSAYVYVSMQDNTVHCLHRDTLKRAVRSNGDKHRFLIKRKIMFSLMQLPNSSLTCVWRNENEHSSKQNRIEYQIGTHDITYMGHIVISIDTHGQLFAFRVQYPHQDQVGNQMSIAYIVSMLEYCLIVGYDALDIFLTLKIQYLDAIVDRLTENFTRQPSSVQQYYYVNFLTMKTNLYRLSIPGQSKAHDLTSLLMLHSILIAFKSLLRPSDLMSHDKGPAENLASLSLVSFENYLPFFHLHFLLCTVVLSESVPDIDKVLLGLEGKDFTVEKSTLQSLQQLIQWVADLALNILAKLPENRAIVGASRNSGVRKNLFWRV